MLNYTRALLTGNLAMAEMLTPLDSFDQTYSIAFLELWSCGEASKVERPASEAGAPQAAIC